MAIQNRLDGGWGWMIVIGSAIVHCILGGYVRGFGIFFSAFQSSFGGNASHTALVNGVRGVLGTLMCPLAIRLIRRIAERLTVMVGASLISLSFILCVFANSMTSVIFVNGIFSGIGSAMVAISGQTIIGQYFDKRKSLASALAFSGSGVGQIALPSLLVYWLHEYGVRGMMLLFGGFTLHLFIVGALYTPFEKFQIYKQSTTKFLDNEEFLENEDGEGGLAEVDHKDSQNSYPLEDNMRSIQLTDGPKAGLLQTSNNLIKPQENDVEPSTVMLIHEIHELDKDRDEADQYSSSNKPDLLENSDVLFLSDSIGSLYMTAEEARGGIKPINDICKAKKDGALLCRLWVKLSVLCGDVFSLAIFRHVRFTLFFISTWIGFGSFLSQSIFLIPRALEQEVLIEQAALLLSILGAVDIVGRVVMGIVADIEWIGPIKVVIAYSLGMAIANVLLPMCTSFATLAIYAVVFGLLGSSTHVLSVPVILTISLRHMLLVAVGMATLAHASSSAILPMLMGLIHDSTGNFASIFYTCAGLQLIVAALMSVILYLNRSIGTKATPGKTQISDNS